MKKDDCSITEDDLASIRVRADLLLRKAAAIGVLPTPIADLVSAAELEIEREAVLDKVYLGRIYKSLPNSIKLVPDRIKRALDKVSGLLDARDRRIHLDKNLHEKRRAFLSLHETAHDFLPWQKDLYQIMEDSEFVLDLDTSDLFERQANCFASEVWFQLDQFAREAADCKFGLITPLRLADRYGASVYSSIRRYVSTNQRPCAVLVFDPPVEKNDSTWMNARRILCSPEFLRQFGRLVVDSQHGPDTFFVQNRPKNKFSA